MAQDDDLKDLTASALIHRDMGRLEGKMSALESRVARNEETVERGFSLVGDKLDRIEGALEAMKIRDAGVDGSHKGAQGVWRRIGTLVTSGIALFASCISLLINFLRH